MMVVWCLFFVSLHLEECQKIVRIAVSIVAYIMVNYRYSNTMNYESKQMPRVNNDNNCASVETQTGKQYCSELTE